MTDVDKNILAMSDEDVLALGPVAFEEPAAVETTEPDPVQEPKNENEPAVEEQESQKTEVVDEPDPAAAAEAKTDEQVSEPDPKDEPAAAAVVEEDGYTDEIGKEALAKVTKLFSSFKASGREVKVESVDEAIQLMQKGINYHDKMASLKPSLNVIRMLEREGLLDQAKLGHLIDLSKKNPEAIAKLVKESGVDLLDVDDKKVADYKPGNYELSATEAALEDVMTDLRGSASFDRVIQFASKHVDPASKQLIVEKPQLLKLFANQIESGVFDLIQAEVTKQKVLGKLDGLNDLEAYDAVGKFLNEQGRFNHLSQQQAPKQAPAKVVPSAKPVVDPAVAAARAAAAPSKARPAPSAVKPANNPLALSDEEFEKQFAKRY